MCIKEIEKRGLNSEGIYRVSGLRDEVEALRIAFDRGSKNSTVSIRPLDQIDFTVIKMFCFIENNKRYYDLIKKIRSF